MFTDQTLDEPFFPSCHSKKIFLNSYFMPVFSLPSFLNKFLNKMAVEFRLSLSTYEFMPLDISHSLKLFS